MTKAGMVAAQQHAQLLPGFASPGEAQQALFSRRDRLLNMLQQAATRNSIFHFDLSPDSLKGLETWYFNLLESDGFRSLDLDRETFEHCISMYVGQVVVQNHPEFRWVVEEYSFSEGKVRDRSPGAHARVDANKANRSWGPGKQQQEAEPLA